MTEEWLCFPLRAPVRETVLEWPLASELRDRMLEGCALF